MPLKRIRIIETGPAPKSTAPTCQKMREKQKQESLARGYGTQGMQVGAGFFTLYARGCEEYECERCKRHPMLLPHMATSAPPCHVVLQRKLLLREGALSLSKIPIFLVLSRRQACQRPFGSLHGIPCPVEDEESGSVVTL